MILNDASYFISDFLIANTVKNIFCICDISIKFYCAHSPFLFVVYRCKRICSKKVYYCKRDMSSLFNKCKQRLLHLFSNLFPVRFVRLSLIYIYRFFNSLFLIICSKYDKYDDTFSAFIVWLNI